MKNTPTLRELFQYLKQGKKIILLSILISTFLFSLLAGYNFYTTRQRLLDPEDQEFLTQEEIMEIMDQEPQDISPYQLNRVEDALEESRYTFSLFIELMDQDEFNNPTLLRELLITDEIVEYIEQNSGYELLPEPEMVLFVTNNTNGAIQDITIGTGNEEANRAIAQAYFDGLLDGNILSYFEDKAVYSLDEEPILAEDDEEWFELLGLNVISPVQTIILSVLVGMIAGLLIGVVIVFISLLSKKEIPPLYGLQYSEEDVVLYFNKLKDVDEDSLSKKVASVINNPANQTKLVLAEKPVSDQIQKNVIKEKKRQVRVFYTDDFSKIDPSAEVDNVVILVKQNETTKNWYKNQRILLEQIKIPITIVQL